MGTWDDNPTTTTLDTRNLQNPQSWVFLETPDTSALLLVRREHITGRSALSKPADRSPTPVSEQRESILSVPVVATASSVPFVSTPATSPGLLRVSPARSVLSSSLSILPTTSWSEPTPSPDPPSSKSMPLLSVNGTRPTTDKTSVADVKSKSVEKKHAERFAAVGKVEPALEKQFEAGRLFAVISSRPGQSGRCDGYILEGEELAFYQRQLRK